MSAAPLRVLAVEDSPTDAKLLEHELRRGGAEFLLTRVETEPEYLAALESADVVLCDWGLPQFDTLRALALLQEHRPDTPFILVSGSIGEEAAVNVIKSGASDYLLKDRLGRLVPAIQKALAESELRAAARRTGDALRRSETQLSEAQRVARLGSWVWEPATGRVQWSDAIYELFGLDRSAVAPSLDAFLSVLHPDDRPAAVARVEGLLAGADEFANDFRLVRPDGRQLWIHSRARAMRDNTGAALRVEGTDQDITDRKRAEAELRFQHALLAAQSEASPDGILVVGTDGRVLDYNRRFLDIWGVPESLIAKGEDLPVLAIAQSRAADPLAFVARVAAICADPGTHSRDEVALADGRVLDRYSGPIRGTDGPVLGRVWYFRDVTDQKRAEAAVRESEERHRLVLRATRDAVWDIDLPSGTVQWSERYTELFGRPPGTSSSLQWWLDHIHPDDRARAHKRLGEALDGTGDHWSCDYRFRRADGAWADIHDRAFITRDEAGRPRRIVGAMQDVTERNRAGAELCRLSGLLSAVVDGTTDAVFVKDRDGKYLLFNEAAARFVGKPVAEVLGRDDTHLFGPSDAQQVMDHDRRVMANGGVETREETITAAGTTRTYLATKAPYRDERGSVVGVIGISRDVTEWKRAQVAVRESEERYRRLVDVLPGAVFINAGGRVVFCNPACLQLLGATDPAQVLGKTPFELFHPTFHVTIRQRIATMIDTRAPVPGLEEEVVRLDGRTVPVHVVATPITDRGRDAILVALTDLTERERSAGLLRSVLGSVSDAILTINERGHVRSANGATERLFGYTEAELLGGNVSTLMPSPDAEQHDGYIANYLRTGAAQVIGIGREIVGRRKDGSTFPADLTVTEFRLDGARHFTGVVRDITARKKLEDQYHHAQKMEAVGQLAGGVAHDFNNLLTVINGYSDLLLAGAPAENPSTAQLAMVREAGERAAGLTAQLLAFSRKTIIAPKILNPNELVAHLGKMLGRLIGEDVTLVTVLAPGLPRVKADPGQLEQVLMNLAVNARDAMPRGGRLTIETGGVTFGPDELPTTDLRAGRFVRLRVADTGCGMKPAVLSRIFEPFFTTKDPGKGTGLGLATVYGIVKQAGGHVSAESEVGVGTRFTILLPAVAEDARPAEAGAAEVAPRGTETVLLVEDERAVLNLARTVLETQGYRVITAPDGVAGLAASNAHQGTIDLLLTDVVMPGFGGRDLAERVRSHRPAARVLYMSGYTADAVIRYGVGTAADSFLQKPFTPLMLARKVRQVLDRR